MNTHNLLSRLRDIVSGEATRLQKLLDKAKALARELEKENLIHIFPLCEYKITNVYGVDGFFAKLFSVFGRSLYVYRVVSVDGLNCRVIEVGEDVVVVEELASEDTREYVEYKMMAIEAKFASKTASKATTLLDGPIVDPPRQPTSQLALREYAFYHEWRAETLGKVADKLIGYIKKPKSCHLSSKGFMAEYMDEEIATIILVTALDDKRDSIGVLGPIELDSPLYDIYREKMGRLNVSFIMLPWWRRARGIEHAILFSEAVKIVCSTTPYGLEHPLPVLCAHKFANIGAEALDALAKYAVTRFMDYFKSKHFKFTQLLLE
ncbi:MAG TPA: hypothetical protein EYH26_01980 [Pyrodictium sp.]|nr:hypothetical protein [Pyrodictium sp.]HIQ55696.1 hypothetical protein [Pyrodictium sp.]